MLEHIRILLTFVQVLLLIIFCKGTLLICIMEHMYGHSVAVKMCWVASCHIWIKCKLCIQDWNCPIRSRHAAEVLPLPRFDQILSWKK